MKTKDERLADLEELLKGVAVLILEALEPDAAEAVYASRGRREKNEAYRKNIHGPYCRKSKWLKAHGETNGAWVYCGEMAGHTGPCNNVRAVAE